MVLPSQDFNLFQTQIMKRILIATLLAAAVVMSASAQRSDDKAAALAVVNQLFTEMAAGNPAGIIALHTPTSDLAGIFKQKDGKSRYQSINGEAFSKMFADKSKAMREEMYDPKIEVSGDWAMVWGRYVFFDGDKLSHCGINQFNLIRTEAGWKIANGASTIDPGDCTEKEKAMKPDRKRWNLGTK